MNKLLLTCILLLAGMGASAQRTGVVTTLASSGAAGSTDGIGTAASFAFPSGVAADAAGNVYIADTYGQKIRRVTTH